jgi:hypothetical protein
VSRLVISRLIPVSVSQVLATLDSLFDVSGHTVSVRYLNEVHKMNAYRAGPSVCPHDLTPKTVEGFGKKIVIEVVPLGTTQKSQFQISIIGNNKAEDKKTCELGSTLAGNAITPYRDVWLLILVIILTLVTLAT